jgi:hypothetical protein
MNESDIIEVLKLLKSAIKNEDWDEAQEAAGYLQEYLDEYDDSDEDY